MFWRDQPTISATSVSPTISGVTSTSIASGKTLRDISSGPHDGAAGRVRGPSELQRDPARLADADEGVIAATVPKPLDHVV